MDDFCRGSRTMMSSLRLWRGAWPWWIGGAGLVAAYTVLGVVRAEPPAAVELLTELRATFLRDASQFPDPPPSPPEKPADGAQPSITFRDLSAGPSTASPPVDESSPMAGPTLEPPADHPTNEPYEVLVDVNDRLAGDAPRSLTDVAPLPTVESALPPALLSEPPQVVTDRPSPRELTTRAMVARRAEEHVRRGFDLAERGALYSARAEFITALRTVGEALDTSLGDREASRALAAGLRALEESEAFLVHGGRVHEEADVRAIAASHRTPAVRELEDQELTVVAALTRYYDYAVEQLTLAAGGTPTASAPLYGLGKVYVSLARQQSPVDLAMQSRAMVFFQSARAVDPRNGWAAHELGVLLAQSGDYDSARALLWESVVASPRAEAWRNLAIVHTHLGEQVLAEQAMHHARTSNRPIPGAVGLAGPRDLVQWIEPAAFAATSRAATELRKPVVAPPPVAAPATTPWPSTVRQTSPPGMRQ
jgi:tetratricopeptide (TPR) repeat protein